MVRNMLWGAVCLLFILAWHNACTKLNEAIKSRDAYAHMLGTCLGNGALWDALGKDAYFCEVIKVGGL